METNTNDKPNTPASGLHEQACSLLCEPGYYIAKWGFDHQTMRIHRRIHGMVKHNYGWDTEKEWLSHKPVKIEHPTLWDRISNLI